MKKILSIALVLLLCLSMLAACGKDGEQNKDDEKGGSKTTISSTPKGDTSTTNANNNETDKTNTDETGTSQTDPANDATLKDAKDFLIQMYQTGNPAEAMAFKASKDVLASAMGYDIVWTVSVSKGDSNAVKISESSKENHVLIELAASVTADTTFTATATISDANGNSEKAEFLFAIAGPKADPKADSTLTVKEAIELGSSKAHNVYTTGKYYIVATVVEVTKAEYGNMKVKDDQGNSLTIYGSYGPDGKDKFTALNPQPKSGDKVKLYGIIGQYNDTPQMKNAWIKEINGKKPATAPTTTRPTSGVKEPAANSEVSIADAIAIGMSKESDVYTANKYYVTGEIVEIYNEDYGNMRIKDSKGNVLTIYGTYGADGAQKYSELANKPKVGDTVTIYGKIGQFGETPQIKNGWITKINGKEQAGVAGELPSPVASPEAGVAYKFGMIQENITSAAIYYLAGGMAQTYYLATTTDPSKAIDVYLEETTGGYYMYTLENDKKTYINMVVSGTHVNGAYEATAKTVYKYDAASKTLKADIDGRDYWFGTRNDKTYNTVGPCAVEYNGFYCMFYKA